MLVCEEVSAVDGFVEVLVFAVALLACDLVACVDSALRADAVRAFDGDHAEEVYGYARFCDADCCGKAREASADDCDPSFIGHDGNS